MTTNNSTMTNTDSSTPLWKVLNEQRTRGKWFVNVQGHPDNGRIQIGSGKDLVCEMYPSPDDEGSPKQNETQAKANAGYSVIAVNSLAILAEALQEVSPLLDGLINRTPSGQKRNELCDLNIKVKTALKAIS